MKKCNKCNISKKVLENYSKKLGSGDGYSNICKDCGKLYRQKTSKERYLKKKHKLNTNIQFKLSENIRSRLRFVVANANIKKPSTENLIGCSVDFFISHLKKSFYDVITYENYGKIWHIDHIIPCDWFDLVDVKQMCACMHYTNLQALLINDNLNKSNRLDWVHHKNGYQITFLRLVYNKYITLPKLTY